MTQIFSLTKKKPTHIDDIKMMALKIINEESDVKRYFRYLITEYKEKASELAHPKYDKDEDKKEKRKELFYKAEAFEDLLVVAAQVFSEK